MIEIELKLQVDEFPNPEGLELLSEKRVVDYYYDTEDYELILTGNFLRNRNNKTIDFKLNLDDLSHTYCKETSFDYNDFSSNLAIRNIFEDIGIEYNSKYSGFEEFLKVNNFKELAVIDKYRRIYKFGEYKVSFDEAADIGKFVEIELDLPDGSDFDKDRISDEMIQSMVSSGFLKTFKRVNIGYVELYLKKNNPQVYALGLFKG